MRVLMITGDRGFMASPRFALQAAQVERLEVVLIARGSLRAAFSHLLRLRKENFDVVTTQDPFWRGLVGWHVAWHKRAKLNVQVHTDLSAQPLLRHILAQVVLRHASSVRVVTEKIKQQVQHMGVKVPISVLPIYIDLSRFQNIVRRSHDTKTILWIGRFEGEKDPLEAIAIFKKVRESGVDAKLIMLGTGTREHRLRECAEGLGMNKHVEFPGWQDPAPYLAEADVVLCTSRHESWGASIIEALAAGVPVVAPDVGVAREVGATVVPREQLAKATIEALHSDTKATLNFTALSKEEWAHAWVTTLH